MRVTVCFISTLIFIFSCESKKASVPLIGTWQLFSATLIEKGDTTLTDYTIDKKFIKIINDSHFSFISHDLNKGKDSLATFSAGAGTYKLVDSSYTEHLEFCSAREWENNDFHFTVSIRNDTLIQTGIEKVVSAGVDRLNIEKYVRVK
jgi:hypothetical protein